MPTHAKKMGKTRGKPLVLYIVQACVGIVDSIFVNGKLANIATHPSPIINLKHIPIPIHRFLRKSFNMNAFYRYGYVLLFPHTGLEKFPKALKGENKEILKNMK